MPGLAGIAGWSGPVRAAALEAMGDAITHAETHHRDSTFVDGLVAGCRVYLAPASRAGQPARHGDIHVWLDGEILPGAHGDSASAIRSAGDIARRYSESRDWKFLRDLNGTFAGVVYDAHERAVHLFSDRYGFRYLYFHEADEGFAWSSEVKAFLHVPEFRPKVDRIAVRQFLGAGYLLANRTTLEGIALVPPASVVSWRYEGTRGRTAVSRYWSWSEIPARTNRGIAREADELGERLSIALDRACAPTARLGLTLSGGLDSRVILAQMVESLGPDVTAVTFGEPGSADARIAAEAARVAGSRHVVVPIGSTNWLEPRLAGVWMTDGQLDLMHMHGIEAQAALREAMDVALNGFAGDVVLGGSFMNPRRLDAGVDVPHVSRFVGLPPEELEGIDAHAGLRHSDYYILENRLRRFIGAGLQLAQTVTEQRRPFFDRDLLTFAYGLPDALRVKSRVYKRALLQRYRSYFRRIPWQKTGLPIGVGELAEDAVLAARRVRARAALALPLLGSGSRGFVSYPEYIRDARARRFFEELLLAPDARVGDFADRAMLRRALAEHFAGADRAATLTRHLTLELWLRQLDDPAWRPRLGATPHAARRFFG